MENNKKTRRSRRKIITQIMCIFLCVLMVGSVFLSILPIGGDEHDGHDHADSEFDGGLTLDEILGSIEIDKKDDSNASLPTTPENSESTDSTNNKTE